MNTLQFIQAIYKKCNEYYSISELLELTNQAQNELLGIDCDVLRTKPDPFLATTNGTFSYSLPAGIRNVGRVYVRNERTFGYGYNQYSPFYLTEDRLGNEIYEIPVYVTPANTPDDQVVITFDVDYGPETASTIYRYEAYNWPEQLTSTSIALSMPLQYITTALMARVMKKIDENRFGRAGDWERKDEMYTADLEGYLNKSRTIERNDIRPFNA